MSVPVKIVAFPFVMLFVYYLLATTWAIIAGLAIWDISVFPSMWCFWTQVDNVGIALARASNWFIAFGAGCSVFFMEV